MINQRRHKRVPITGTATLNFEDKDGVKSLQTMTVNISLSGVGLYSDEPIETNTGVSTTINFISTDGFKTDSIEGFVVYDRDVGDMYFIGIQFSDEINLKNQPLLYEHIKKILAWDK